MAAIASQVATLGSIRRNRFKKCYLEIDAAIRVEIDTCFDSAETKAMIQRRLPRATQGAPIN